MSNAARLAEQIASSTPDDKRSQLNLAATYLQTEQYDKAAAVYEALRARGVHVVGIAFIGEAHEENERIIPHIAGVPSLGRLPLLDPLDRDSLAAAFRAHIHLPDNFNGR